MTAATSLFDDIRVAPHIERRASTQSTFERRLLKWLAGRWEAACRRAEDPRRVVPRY